MEQMRKAVGDIVSGGLEWYLDTFLAFLFLGGSDLMQFINPTRVSEPITSNRNLPTNSSG